MDSLDDIKTKIADAITQLDIADREARLSKLETEALEPDFWNDSDSAQVKSKAIAKLKSQIEPWRKIETRVSELADMSQIADKSMEQELDQELARIGKDYQKLEKSLMLNGPYDSYDAVLSIHAGTGGTDAMDWAQMLERMYLRFAEKKAWKTSIIDETSGGEAGIKSATIIINGDNAYGELAGEHGVHRLVRLSPFNSDSLRQTSFALVEVVPDIDQPEDVEIDDSEIRIDVFRAGGHGGQSVNTTDSAVRITHIATGIVISVQNERSQIQNKATAMKILRGKLAQLQIEQHAEKLSEVKGPDKQAIWGNQIRNYVLHPYTMVKDARSKFETTDAQDILDGNLDGLVEAYLRANMASK
jgi:peptide chain release factor 2